jgi:23S rRNA (cytosine1962-C5)-methyltransferase
MTSVEGLPTARVILKPRRAQPFLARHPWLYAGAIDRIEGDPADGAVVEVCSASGVAIARGLYNSRSKIRVRLYSWLPDETLDRDFFAKRIQEASNLRHQILHCNTGPDAAYRLVFSEADRLSGLIVDRYGDWLTVQFTSLALAMRREMIADILRELLPVRGIYLRTERGIGVLEGLELQDGPLWGELPPTEIIVTEHQGLRFAVNLAEGQKTGFYLDQRDNRAAVMRLAAGRRVLDAFSYSGGFGVYAAKGGARDVLCLDASEAALKLAERNAILNGLGVIRTQPGDVFSTLEQLAATGRRFDLIVLDPPKFARNQSAIPRALQGYRTLHQRALKLLEADGVLVSCCCTGLITQEMLEDLLAQVASDARRDLQILERRGPAADHPVAISCRESSYLKCIISRVV